MKTAQSSSQDLKSYSIICNGSVSKCTLAVAGRRRNRRPCLCPSRANHTPLETRPATPWTVMVLLILSRSSNISAASSRPTSRPPQISTTASNQPRSFARLRHIFRNRAISLQTKGIIYGALLTSILLYGCETWSILEADLRRLRSFRRRSIRETLRVAVRQTWKDRIKSSHLSALLGIRNLVDSYRDRLLRWTGVLCRMPLDRLPRRLMTSWVQHPRRRGGQQKTWGRTVTTALRARGVPTEFKKWNALAQNKRTWRERVRSSLPRLPPDWKKKAILEWHKTKQKGSPTGA